MSEYNFLGVKPEESPESDEEAQGYLISNYCMQTSVYFGQGALHF